MNHTILKMPGFCKEMSDVMNDLKLLIGDE